MLGPSNLAHIRLMMRGRHPLLFKVWDQESKLHPKHYVKPGKEDKIPNRLSQDHQTWYTYLLRQEGDIYCFSRSGVKGQGHVLNIVIKPCKH